MGGAAAGAEAAHTNKGGSLPVLHDVFHSLPLCSGRLPVRAPRFDLVHYLAALIGSGHGTTWARRGNDHYGLQSARRARDP